MKGPLLAAGAVLLAACAAPTPRTDAGVPSPAFVSGSEVPRVLAKSARAPRTSRSHHARPVPPATATHPPRRSHTPPGQPAATRAGTINWDAIAACESGGHWHHHQAAHGLYWGGLQMSLRTWRSFHGDRVAPRPDLASKVTQISVAEHIARAEGLGAWPTCGRYA